MIKIKGYKATQASKANTVSVSTFRQVSGRMERKGSRFHKLKKKSIALVAFKSHAYGLSSMVINTIRTYAGVDKT